MHLPAGDYQVQVTDDYGVLNGYVVTVLGPNQGAGQQQPGAAVQRGAAGRRLQPDRGLRLLKPRLGAIGDFVWYDANRDGVQDVGEPGIANVRMALY